MNWKLVKENDTAPPATARRLESALSEAMMVMEIGEADGRNGTIEIVMFCAVPKPATTNDGGVMVIE